MQKTTASRRQTATIRTTAPNGVRRRNADACATAGRVSGEQTTVLQTTLLLSKTTGQTTRTPHTSVAATTAPTRRKTAGRRHTRTAQQTKRTLDGDAGDNGAEPQQFRSTQVSGLPFFLVWRCSPRFLFWCTVTLTARRFRFEKREWSGRDSRGFAPPQKKRAADSRRRR